MGPSRPKLHSYPLWKSKRPFTGMIDNLPKQGRHYGPHNQTPNSQLRFPCSPFRLRSTRHASYRTRRPIITTCLISICIRATIPRSRDA